MKFTDELFAKVSLIRLLLSPRKSLSNEVASERESKRVHKAKLNFISILVRTTDKILMNFPSSDNILSLYQGTKSHLFSGICISQEFH
jgi:nucleolar pre-ribosomal-associated protein 1